MVPDPAYTYVTKEEIEEKEKLLSDESAETSETVCLSLCFN